MVSNVLNIYQKVIIEKYNCNFSLNQNVFFFYISGNTFPVQRGRKRTYTYVDDGAHNLETPIASTSTKAIKINFDPVPQFQNNQMVYQSSLATKMTEKGTASYHQGKILNL